jgi:hypothetical protein
MWVTITIADHSLLSTFKEYLKQNGQQSVIQCTDGSPTDHGKELVYDDLQSTYLSVTADQKKPEKVGEPTYLIYLNHSLSLMELEAFGRVQSYTVNLSQTLALNADRLSAQSLNTPPSSPRGTVTGPPAVNIRPVRATQRRRPRDGFNEHQWNSKLTDEQWQNPVVRRLTFPEEEGGES